MKARWAVALVAAMAPVFAYGQAPPAAPAHGVPPPAINSPLFARRPPPPGQFSYLQSIRFIEDGMRYLDPLSAFFISPAGEMCFRKLPDAVTNIYETYHKYWCVYPQAVGRVEAAQITDEVRLWCLHQYPQCVHRVGARGMLDYSNPTTNLLSVETVANEEERDALVNLIYVMGGAVRAPEPARLY